MKFLSAVPHDDVLNQSVHLDSVNMAVLECKQVPREQHIASVHRSGGDLCVLSLLSEISVGKSRGKKILLYFLILAVKKISMWKPQNVKFYDIAINQLFLFSI